MKFYCDAYQHFSSVTSVHNVAGFPAYFLLLLQLIHIHVVCYQSIKCAQLTVAISTDVSVFMVFIVAHTFLFYFCARYKFYYCIVLQPTLSFRIRRERKRREERTGKEGMDGREEKVRQTGNLAAPSFVKVGAHDILSVRLIFWQLCLLWSTLYDSYNNVRTLFCWQWAWNQNIASYNKMPSTTKNNVPLVTSYKRCIWLESLKQSSKPH